MRPLTYIRGVDANGCVSYAPANSFALTVQDTPAIDLTLAGNTLSATVVVSPNSGNQLQLLANGLYVPAAASINVQDTSTVDLTLSGGVLSANAIVSPNAGNALQALANGLYVPTAASITVQDTSTVDLTLSGGVLSADAIISPNAGNALQALANGLYVQDPDLRNCANQPLPPGTRVLTCPQVIPGVFFNINSPITSTILPIVYMQFASKPCPEPLAGDYAIIADSSGNVSYTNLNEAVSHFVNTNPVVLPNIPLVTIQAPTTGTGVIDSVTLNNPLSCSDVFIRGNFLIDNMQHTLNNTSAAHIAVAQAAPVRRLITRLDIAGNTPGVSNTPVTSHQWPNKSATALAWESASAIELGPRIAPNASQTVVRSVFVYGSPSATNYFVTVSDWSLNLNILKL